MFSLNFQQKLEPFTKSRTRILGYENKEKHPICVSQKCYEKKHVDLLLLLLLLLLLGEEGKRHHCLIKDFNTFMSDHPLNCGTKNFCRYCLQAFSTK